MIWANYYHFLIKLKYTPPLYKINTFSSLIKKELTGESKKIAHTLIFTYDVGMA